jgi:branched-subunit amino acid aminotransferase/4-amino-4-deoxychorismate lyase
MDSPSEPPRHEPIAYLNGEFLPLRAARIPVWDLGIVQAATVTEAIRTFRHAPFRLDDHLSRLEHSLRGIHVTPRESIAQIRHVINELTKFNLTQAADKDDLLINLFVTAGESRVHSGGMAVEPGRATVCITTRPLECATAARHYRDGLSLVIPSVRHIPGSIIDPAIKYRSRLHWYLADYEARQSDPESEALLLDLDGFVTETARGNIFARFGDGLKTPSEKTTLNGVSQQVVLELCGARSVSVERSNITATELAAADEILMSSTSACLVPVTRLNGRPVGTGRPGQLWQDLINDWSAAVGVDIVAQTSVAP